MCRHSCTVQHRLPLAAPLPAAFAGEMCEDIARNVVSMNAWLDALQERQAVKEEAQPGNTSASSAEQHQQQQEQQQQQPPSPPQLRRQLSEAAVAMGQRAGAQAAAEPVAAANQQLQANTALEQQQLERGARQLAAAASPFPPKARERYSNAFDSDLTPVEVARNAQQVRGTQ